MKQKHFYGTSLFLMLVGIMMICSVANAQDIQLPVPQKDLLGGSLMQVLQNRHSVRRFDSKMLSNQTLSNLLWAANGVNRADGRRTAPSAINAQDIEMYVALNGSGVYHYEASANKLMKVSDANLRELIVGRNVFINDAPVVVLLMSNQGKFKRFPGNTLGAMDAGYVSQNIYLYCTAFGLGTVACAPKMDATAVQQMLGLSADYIPLIYHPVGYMRE